jgi:putative peptidoglycan lipid II flippase
LGFHRHFGAHILSWGFSAGELLRWIVTIILLKRKTSWRFGIRWQGPATRILEFFKQTGFQIIALLAVQLIVVVDQWFAAKMGVGSLSYLTYADRLLQVSYILFLSGLAQVFLSYWSDSYFREPELFWGNIKKDIRGVLMLSVPLAVLMWLLRKPLVFFVFHFSKISHEELLKIADIFGWFVVGFVPGLIRLLYGRILLILKQSRFYCMQSWTELILNGFFDYLFGRMFGIAGIAMSTSMVYYISTIWLHFYFKKYRSLQ